MNIKKLGLLLVLLFGSPLIANEVWILVPGTYAADYDWYQPEGPFFEALKEQLATRDEARLVAFRWSGGVRHSERVAGAKLLKSVVQSYPVETKLYIVAHSHGGNVVNLCTQLLARDSKNQHRIEHLFLLGTPVSERYYSPNYQIVKKIMNFFSFKDDIQPVFNYFKRTLPEHPQCANFRLRVNKVDPTHFTLHDREIGTWLPRLADMVSYPVTPGPQLLQLFNEEAPRIEHDPYQFILQGVDDDNHNGYLYHFGSFKRALLEMIEVSPNSLTPAHLKKMTKHLHLGCAQWIKKQANRISSAARSAWRNCTKSA